MYVRTYVGCLILGLIQHLIQFICCDTSLSLFPHPVEVYQVLLGMGTYEAPQEVMKAQFIENFEAPPPLPPKKKKQVRGIVPLFLHQTHFHLNSHAHTHTHHTTHTRAHTHASSVFISSVHV